MKTPQETIEELTKLVEDFRDRDLRWRNNWHWLMDDYHNVSYTLKKHKIP